MRLRFIPLLACLFTLLHIPAQYSLTEEVVAEDIGVLIGALGVTDLTGYSCTQLYVNMINDDDWRRLGFIAATLRTSDFDVADGMDLIGKLFAEDDVRVFESKPVVFRCRCSRARAEEVLRMLGEDETGLP